MSFTLPSRDNQGYQGRFYERTFAGQVFKYGAASAALVAANATATGLSATAQPIIGIWNPSNSNVNLVVLKTMILITGVAASSVSPGAFMWLTSSAQSAISTGAAGVNSFIGGPNTPPTSIAKAYAMSTALTGLSGNLTNTQVPFDSTQIVTQQTATTAALMGGQSEEPNDGDWIVGPGGLLVIMGTASTTTVSVASKIEWAEIPVTGV